MRTKRVTLADVAQAAGVSRTTASLVLSNRGAELRISEAAQQRVRQVAREFGYRPNAVSAALRTGSSGTIGFISDTVTTSQLASELVKGALNQARQRGYLLFIGESEGDASEEQRLVDAMLDRQVEGIILASMFTREAVLPESVDPAHAVLLNAYPERERQIACLIPDEHRAGREAVALLVEAGHRDIHVIGTGLDLEQVPLGSVAGRERLAGILERLDEAGLGLASARPATAWLPQDGYRLAQDLVASGATHGAVITFNDRLGFGVYQALNEAGFRIPEDFSIVSFDDHALAGWMRPGLTTFALPFLELGRQSVDMLLTSPEDRPADPVRVPMPLRQRGSIALQRR